MPVGGVLDKDTRHVRFQWISVRSVVSFIFTFFALVEVYSIVAMAAANDISLGIAGIISKIGL